MEAHEHQLVIDENTGPHEHQENESAPSSNRQRLALIGLSVVAVLILALFVVAVIYLLQPGAPTETIRDVFIIFMALEFLVVGLALIVLIVQLARLINLLQNEVRPILESTSETAHTLRGTATFLSDNLVQPVIRANSYMAALRRLFKLVRPGR
jgi:hypothetical protein